MLRQSILLVRVTGKSMEPTFSSGTLVLALRFPPRRRLSGIMRSLMLRRGAVVIAHIPNHPQWLLIKRVTALDGEWCIWWNEANEPIKQQIPVGHVFLQGDAPAIDTTVADSRVYGPFPIETLYARVILTLFRSGNRY